MLVGIELIREWLGKWVSWGVALEEFQFYIRGLDPVTPGARPLGDYYSSNNTDIKQATLPTTQHNPLPVYRAKKRD